MRYFISETFVRRTLWIMLYYLEFRDRLSCINADKFSAIFNFPFGSKTFGALIQSVRLIFLKKKTRFQSLNSKLQANSHFTVLTRTYVMQPFRYPLNFPKFYFSFMCVKYVSERGSNSVKLKTPSYF